MFGEAGMKEMSWREIQLQYNYNKVFNFLMYEMRK